jgi:hypothetical protein
MRAGWLDGEEVFLESAAAFAVAQRFAREQDEPFPISEQALRRRLHERGLLASTDEGRGRLLVRRVLQGERRAVLHVVWQGNDTTPAPGGPDTPEHGTAGKNGTADQNGAAGGGGHSRAPAGAGVGRMGRMGRQDAGDVDGPGPEMNGHEEWGE